MILYINACVRKQSRTNQIAIELLNKSGEPYEEIKLANIRLKPLSNKQLQKRMSLIDKKDYSDSMFKLAKQFAKADTIVISAPFWDQSFPSILKVYLENIYVLGTVSEYGDDGIPHGLCKANKLYYVTSAGGPYIPDYSYDYIRNLAIDCFGIKETSLIKAEMLDIQGCDEKRLLSETINAIKE